MRYTARIIVALVIGGLAHSLALDGSAFGLTQISSPFGTAPVLAYVGQADVTPGPQMVVWKRLSDGACMNNAIGTDTGLNDDYDIVGGSGNDNIRIIAGEKIDNFCFFSLRSLIYNGHYLDLHGGAGNDHLTSSNGDSWLFGDDGNDVLYFAGMGNLFGGNGNDC